jgi:hypothetical protein
VKLFLDPIVHCPLFKLALIHKPVVEIRSQVAPVAMLLVNGFKPVVAAEEEGVELGAVSGIVTMPELQ